MTVRIGLIGAGGMGRAHLARIANDLSGGEIVAVADINHDAAVSAAEPYGAKAYDSSDELIDVRVVDELIGAVVGLGAVGLRGRDRGLVVNVGNGDDLAAGQDTRDAGQVRAAHAAGADESDACSHDVSPR